MKTIIVAILCSFLCNIMDPTQEQQKDEDSTTGISVLHITSISSEEIKKGIDSWKRLSQETKFPTQFKKKWEWFNRKKNVISKQI